LNDDVLSCITTFIVCGVYPELVEGSLTASLEFLLSIMEVSLLKLKAFRQRTRLQRSKMLVEKNRMKGSQSSVGAKPW